MSSPLALAAVTAALKDLLNDGLLNHDLSQVGSFSVTALPPDRVTVGQNEVNQLNLFLYRVTPNLGWRNAELPRRNAAGDLLCNPLLALDLHYLLSAYGAEELNAETLLGFAMYLLHETPVLSRDQLRVSLGAPSPVDGTVLPSPFGDLSAIDLADQVELIKIVPEDLNTEDMSKIWTSLQARYRPTAAYMASVVLIEGASSTDVAPPVLTRGAEDRGPFAIGAPSPALTAARPLASESLPAMRLGDDLLASGSNLGGGATLTAVFDSHAASVPVEISPEPGGTANSLRLHIPSVLEDAATMDDWAAGLYQLQLRVEKPGVPVWTTNSVPVALAPLIQISPLNATPGDLALTITCSPRLRSEQEASTSLIFGRRAIAPDSISTPADPTLPTTLSFTVPGVAVGEYLVRLRVQGVDSLPVLIAGDPPVLEFDPQQKVTVA